MCINRVADVERYMITTMIAQSESTRESMTEQRKEG